jgi:hypothetical protein
MPDLSALAVLALTVETILQWVTSRTIGEFNHGAALLSKL